MVNLLISTVLGFLAGLGIGGGSLLMIYLTTVLAMPLPQARTLNLLFFLPCAAAASITRLKGRLLPLAKLPIPILAGCVSAWGFSHLAGNLDENLLRKGFGVLLLFTALRELRYRERKLR